MAIAVEVKGGVLPAERLADDQRRPVRSDHRTVRERKRMLDPTNLTVGRDVDKERDLERCLLLEIETEVAYVGVPIDRHDHVVAEVRGNLRHVGVHDRLASGGNGHDSLGGHRDVQKGAVRHPTEARGLVVDGELTTFAVVADRKDTSPVKVGKPEPFIVPTRPLSEVDTGMEDSKFAHGLTLRDQVDQLRKMVGIR